MCHSLRHQELFLSVTATHMQNSLHLSPHLAFVCSGPMIPSSLFWWSKAPLFFFTSRKACQIHPTVWLPFNTKWRAPNRAQISPSLFWLGNLKIQREDKVLSQECKWRTACWSMLPPPINISLPKVLVCKKKKKKGGWSFLHGKAF